MKLTLGSGPEIEDPTNTQIESALRALPGGGDSFAILGLGEQHYIQTAGGAADGFVLEYREGSEDQHYRCRNAVLSLEEVLAAFLSYRRGDEAFKTALPWEKEEGSVSSSWVAQGMLVFFIVVGALVLWRVFS